MHAAEYVFMMRAGTLKQFLPGDWQVRPRRSVKQCPPPQPPFPFMTVLVPWLQERAEDMRKLREAFDTADVDGDNQLELEELEMVILTMNPKAETTQSDIQRVWKVLNPEGNDWIPFSEFVHGMITVKRDPELSSIIPLDVPNRFQLLSLLIDTPINEEQEQLIFNKLSALEKMGIKMLNKMKKPPPTREEIAVTLQAACKGKLHYLTDVQRKNVNNTHYCEFCISTASHTSGGHSCSIPATREHRSSALTSDVVVIALFPW